MFTHLAVHSALLHAGFTSSTRLALAETSHLRCAARARRLLAVHRVTDGLAPAALAALKAGGATVVSEPISDPSDLAAHDAVIIRSATTLGAGAPLAAGAAGKLRVVGRAGVGVDNIDLAAAAAAGLWVLNTPGASTAWSSS